MTASTRTGRRKCWFGRSTHRTRASGLIEVETVGNGDDVYRRYCNEFAVAAVNLIAQYGELAALILQTGNALRAVIARKHGSEKHTLTGFEAGDVFADFDDFPGNVAAQDVRQLDPGESLADPEIEMIQGAGFDADQNLVFARLWVGDIFVAKDFRPAKFMETNGFHIRDQN